VFSPVNQHLGYIFDAYFESPIRTTNYLAPITQKGAKNTIQISDSTFLSKGIYLPKLEGECQKIAECLGSLGKLIGAEREKLDVLKAYKKALMEQLFPREGETVPRLRFPEFQGAGEWEHHPLKEITVFVKDRISVSDVNRANYASTENLMPDFGGISPASSIPVAGNVVSYQQNDILVANIRPYLKKIWLSDKNGGASNDVIVIRAKPEIKHQYLSQVLKNDRFVAFVMSGAKGLKMPRGDTALIREYSVPTPKIREQSQIAACLFMVDDMVDSQSELLETLQVHKQGLMQQVFPSLEKSTGL
jgi:type I restriction enzyme S subunit